MRSSLICTLFAVATAGSVGHAQESTTDWPPRAITLRTWCMDRGGCGLEIAGGERGELAWLVFGGEPSAIELPWGGLLETRPDLVLPVGRFAADGYLHFRLPELKRPGAAGGSSGIAFAQAVVLAGAESGRLRSFVSNTRMFDLRAEPPKRAIRASLRPNESAEGETIEWVLDLEMDVPTGGHRLELGRIDRGPEGSAITRVYVVHTPPDATEIVPPVRETLRLSVELGALLGGVVEVWCATDSPESEPEPEKVAELRVDGTG